MIFASKKEKTPLPVSAETAKELKEQLKHNSLRDFARKHILTPEHFVVACGPANFSPLTYAAFWGKLDRVIEVLRDSDQRLDGGHFLTPDGVNLHAVRVAASHNGLPQIFVPSYWQGRIGEMEKLWANVPQEHRRDIDYPALQKEAVLLSVRAAFARAQNEKAGRALAGKERA